jgi:hypothetical protein
MISSDSGKPQRPSRTEQSPGAAEVMRSPTGSSKAVGEAATPISNTDVTQGFIAAGVSSMLAEGGVGPGRLTPDRSGDDSNLASISNKSQGFPQAAEGPGTGRQPAQPGQTVSGTSARPRTSFSPSAMGGAPPRPGQVRPMPRGRK